MWKIYKQKLQENLKECHLHLGRLENAISALGSNFPFPLQVNSYKKILSSTEFLAYADQIIYRFAKLQDCMGAKLFKSILLFQGETGNLPFLDVLNELEKMEILNVERWFELRDLRNEISHEYGEKDDTSIQLLNKIYDLINELKTILERISKMSEKYES